MNRSTNYLYWRISGILLGLLIILGVAYILITGFIGRNYYQEASQRINRELADSTVALVKPLVDGKVDTFAIKDIMHSMMVINPSVEVYLLDTNGTIITYVAPNKRVKLEKVELGPVKNFIENKEDLTFIKGEDPRKPETENVFSAAPITENGKLTGYLYIILASEVHADVLTTLSGSYLLRLGLYLFILALGAALLIGLVAIWLLTRNVRTVVHTVKNFKEGDYEARVQEKHLKVLPPLGETFNEMADTIVSNIEKLEAVEKLRRELIANVSHDLRTPLAVVRGYVETLQMKNDDFDPQNREKYLGVILKNTDNLEHLINQLFEYSKLEAKQISPKKEPFFINELAQDTIQNYKMIAQEKGVDLKLEVPKEPMPLVYADIGLVERVFQNLIDNALKYTPSGGQVILRLLSGDQSVEIKVVDTGVGIPEEEQSFIFDRYHQRNPGEKNSAGLGLAIVQKILELHNSTIAVQSKLNQGTSFTFQLPVYS